MERSVRPDFPIQTNLHWHSCEPIIISDLPPKRFALTKTKSTSLGAFQRIERIVSGGQTGVDRAALDMALALQIPHGGWCPLGRIAEDGQIPDRYLLEEHSSPKYSERTKLNVTDSDATLVLYSSNLEGGTFKTVRYAESVAKPCLKIRLTHPGRIERVHEWLEKNNVRTLNIAGPRASKEPAIYQSALDYLMRVFALQSQVQSEPSGGRGSCRASGAKVRQEPHPPEQ